MIRLTIIWGEDEQGTQAVYQTRGGTVWVSDVEDGLCVQKVVRMDGIWYGVTHLRSGRVVLPQMCRYLDARACQRALLTLPVNWTQGYDEVATAAVYELASPIVQRYADLGVL